MSWEWNGGYFGEWWGSQDVDPNKMYGSARFGFTTTGTLTAADVSKKKKGSNWKKRKQDDEEIILAVIQAYMQIEEQYAEFN